ncbi:UNVERIFIED_CONTAM: ImmA/IrrE family metallo-endopeptidase [Campylobacter lari]
MENLFDYLVKKTNEAFDLKVKYENTKSAHGYVVNSLKEITLNENLSIRNKIQAFLHEIAHFLLNHNYEKTPRAICEFEAELTGYLVGSALGIKDKETSFSYIKE